jgi:hypothetical protein
LAMTGETIEPWGPTQFIVHDAARGLHARFAPPREQPKDLLLGDRRGEHGKHRRVGPRGEKLRQIHVHHPVDRFTPHLVVELAPGIGPPTPRPEPRREVEEHGLVDGVKEPPRHLLNDLVCDAADPQGTPGAVGLGNLDLSPRLWPVRPLRPLLVQGLKVRLQMLPVHRFGDPISSGRLRAIKRLDACPQVVHRDVVHQRRVSRLRLPASPIGYPFDSCFRRASTSACGRRCRRAGN